jgi:DNA-binding CsgD family transcriptional regulator
MGRRRIRTGGAMIIGRGDELARLDAFLRDPDERPSVLLLQGEAGIGKTTVFAAGIGTATDRGVRSVSARPAEPDVELAFSALTDLLRPLVGDLADELPEPQRRAIAVALLEEGDPQEGTDLRAVSAGVQTLLALASEQGPLLVAIDDAQWIDPSSDRVLAFALRRAVQTALRLVLSVRSSDHQALSQGVGRAIGGWSSETIELGPLGVDDIASIVADAIGERPNRRERIEIHHQSGGNPFYAVELARAARRGDDRPTGLALPVPKSLRDDLVRRRFALLSDGARETLLVASATARPTVALVGTVVGAERLEDALEQAEGSGVATVAAGEIRFAHPLYRSAIYADASRTHRHRVHAAIAEAVVEPEERGRQLALSSDVADEEIAAAIERAAAFAGARGAPDAAADLLDHAVRLTPAGETAALARRLHAAGRYRFDAGDAALAIELTLRAADLAAPGPERAAALASLGEMERFVWRVGESRGHLEAALEEPNLGDAAASGVHAQLFWTLQLLDDTSGAVEHAEQALALGRTIVDRPTRARAFAAAARARFLADGSSADDLAREAPELWDPVDGLPVHEWPRWLSEEHSLVLATDIDRTIGRLTELLSTAEERGDEPSKLVLLCALASAHRHRPDWSDGVAFAREAVDVGAALGGAGQELALLAWYEAATGALDAARLDADRCLERIADVGNTPATLPSLTVLAEVESMLGPPGDACERVVEELSDVPRRGTGAPLPRWPAAAEAAIAAGHPATAEPVARWLRERGTTLGSPSVVGVAERIHGRVLAADRDWARAERALVASVQAFEAAGLPFELGRTLLYLGDVRRHAGHKRLAREVLTRSRSIFESLGAATWVARVDEALGHITGRRPSMGELTDAELRVARLAAGGHQNHEIADLLSISVRTVEGHLSSVYAKLRIRSRTELAAYFGDEL